MNKLWVIAHREYVAMVGTKAFIFTLVMMPVLMFGSLIAIPAASRVDAGKTRRIAVFDGTRVLMPTILSSSQIRESHLSAKGTGQTNPSNKSEPKADRKDDFLGADQDHWIFESVETPISDELRTEYSNKIRSNELHAFVEIAETALDDSQSSCVFYSQDAFISDIRAWLSQVLSEKIRQIRIQKLGLESLGPEVWRQLDNRIELSPSQPLKKNESKDSGNKSKLDALIALFLPFGVMMLMFMVILMAAQPMLESAMEEKSLRISELLLGSVTPTQLLGGKLLGNVAGSLVIFILYGAGGLFLLNYQNLADKIPLTLVPWFVLFQLLGVLFFSSIFLTVGATVNELKEAQTLLLPIWMVLMAPLMVWFVAVREPNGLIATSLSFFPPSCPMMMVLRLASGTDIPIWQPVVAACIMIASTGGMVWIAGRIYRNGLLRNEGVRSLLQLFRQIKSVR
jgi:ABC-2 type transport system permease protein